MRTLSLLARSGQSSAGSFGRGGIHPDGCKSLSDSSPIRVLPANSQVIIVSPVDGQDVRALSVMVARGYSVLVVRPDPLSLQPLPAEPAREASIAARLLRIDRVLTVRELERAGVPIVSWDVNEPLDECIRASIPRLRVWRGRRMVL